MVQEINGCNYYHYFLSALANPQLWQEFDFRIASGERDYTIQSLNLMYCICSHFSDTPTAPDYQQINNNNMLICFFIIIRTEIQKLESTLIIRN